MEKWLGGQKGIAKLESNCFLGMALRSWVRGWFGHELVKMHDLRG